MKTVPSIIVATQSRLFNGASGAGSVGYTIDAAHTAMLANAWWTLPGCWFANLWSDDGADKGKAWKGELPILVPPWCEYLEIFLRANTNDSGSISYLSLEEQDGTPVAITNRRNIVESNISFDTDLPETTTAWQSFGIASLGAGVVPGSSTEGAVQISPVNEWRMLWLLWDSSTDPAHNDIDFNDIAFKFHASTRTLTEVLE